MDTNSLEIKNKTNYNLDSLSYIDDFDVNSLKITKTESRIGANIYYTRCDLNLDNDTIIPLYFIINRLIGYIEEMEGSSDKYLVVASSVRNKNIISVMRYDTILIRYCVIEKNNEYYPEIYLDECLYVKDIK